MTAPVPPGYAFPVWNVGGGGAAALLEGDLFAAAGCLYIQPDRGPRYLVVWPDTLHLVLDGETAVVMAGPDEVARAGDPVRLGGGEVGPDLTPPSATGCDTANVWGANEVIPADL